MDLLLKRLFVILLALLIITACESSDPAVLRSQAASIERQWARQTAEARAYQAEIEAQYQAATAQAEAETNAEIERIQAAGQATATAIMAREAELDLTAREAQATREAAEYSIAATSTAQAVQATRTALALAIDYEPTRIAGHQFRSELINQGISLVTVAFMIFLAITGVILILFLRNYLNWRIEWQDRKASLIHTPDGTVKYVNGEPELLRDDTNRIRKTIRESKETDIEWLSPSVVAGPPALPPDQLRDAALRLLEWVKEDQHVPGWRDIDWSSSTWQKAIGYLVGLKLVEKNGDGYTLVAGVREVRYQLTSPALPTVPKN